ncbi:MsnO8 family LLM class oxidoreductase [Agrobacterium vitis]|uniref:MsnO8 family LLM class oxidoreductase n=1 Tax=Agrobacterium vitis TaxID=373 RepID=UPI00087307F4|nr:MsnO8 family LLM class oxidoreductase [Agrobacterium vitis]MCE6078053.1 MsnO8 family LLM class oxidoreductase [Agrobacterium vitis]MUO72868.1 MsnO8 family LLM class oxidoreductase [Agrobacterium vitis]MUO86928.1 MsnO8 family LLM class oxidoreductase [Agrobacterium vitis]MVA37958.1 MsnO8 family LLM class oxidoreductase [Agrobacterium vitis]
MTYSLSLLDKSPVEPDAIATDALKTTVALATRAEALGYKRFWLAEHHNIPALASSAPETLIAYLLAKTSHIRIGSGGVMLQHYSPYKVAETFNLLASLAPGRVDLGVGKAPGGFPHATRALRTGQADAPPQDFEKQIEDLNRYLLTDAAAANELLATPVPTIPAERFLLGASAASAKLAAAKGWTLVFAGHLNGDQQNLQETFDVYRRETGGKTPILALAAFAAEQEDLAKSRVADIKIFKVILSNGVSVNVGNPEQAAEFARQSGVTDYRIEEKTPHVLAGTGEQVRKELDTLHADLGVSEFIIDIPVPQAALRLNAIEQIAASRLSLAA